MGRTWSQLCVWFGGEVGIQTTNSIKDLILPCPLEMRVFELQTRASLKLLTSHHRT